MNIEERYLQEKFFSRPTIAVAKSLLGKYLVRKWRGKIISAMITEVEAYDGLNDKASHASRGMTPRNIVMFGPAGRWFVYFTYGMHFMLNAVTGKEGYPAAILIRGVEGINGPGRVTKFFHIDKKLNSKPISKKSGLWIEDRLARLSFNEGGGVKIKPSQIKKSPRIGVDYAGPVWAKKCYRFYVDK